MGQDFFRQLSSFKKNLDYQIEDLYLEARGIITELYFDTADVYEAILGKDIFYTFNPGFDLPRFNDKKTLVHSLVSSGWLGQIHLLPPHQIELLAKLDLYQGVGAQGDPKGLAKKFLADIGLANIHEFQTAPLENLRKEQLIEFIKRQAGLAEALFKAVQCIGPWHRRLPRLMRYKILTFHNQLVDYEQLIKSEDFERIKRAFDSIRPHSSTNNLADAAALMLLIIKTAEFKRGDSLTVPRFFLSTPTFKEVINATGVSDALIYESPVGGTSSVLRNADYYVFKASFGQRRRDITALAPQLPEVSEPYLSELREKMEIILESQERVTAEALSQISFYGRPLDEVIRDLQLVSFLENVWLNFEAPRDVDYAIREIVEVSQEISRNEKFQQGVANAIETIKEQISESVSEFKWVSSLWNRLEKASAQLRTALPLSNPDFFRDFGLFRYGFPPSTHEHISALLQELFEGEEEGKDSRIAVITACYRGRENPAENLDSLIIGAAILLVTEMYAEISFLLAKIGDLPHYSLKIVLTETLLRLKSRSEQGASLLKQLEGEYEGMRDSRVRPDLAVGLAFLFFRLWHSRGGEAEWRRPTTPKRVMLEGLRVYSEEAIRYAQAAYDLLGEHELLKKVYALNQYLYYLVESADETHIQEMRQAAKHLSFYKANRDVWQFRFDDTLARYFHRLAKMAETKEEWEQSIGTASRLIDEARRNAPWNEEVEAYATIIAVEMSSGFTNKL